MPADPPRPLIVTDDAELLDDLLRLAAAGGVEIDVAHDPTNARFRWHSAPLVLIGGAQASACVHARLPRRASVVLVAREHHSDRPSEQRDTPADDALWATAGELGAEHLVFLPTAEAWLVDRFADIARGPSEAGQVIAVIGGRGGAGASVLAAALAVTASRQGLRPLLVDADPLGGGLDLVIGGESEGGLRWPDLAETSGQFDSTRLLSSLPRVGELCVLSWDRGDLLGVPAEAIEAAVDAGRRGSDLVVVDLPRHLDEGAIHALQRADLALLVIPAELRACMAAARVARTIRPHCARLQGVVRGPAPGRLRSAEVAATVGVDLAGVVRSEPGLVAALERGEMPAGRGRGPLAQLCRQILAPLFRTSGAA